MYHVHPRVLIAATLLLFAHPLAAQSTSGSQISGVVQDVSGSTVPGAEVRATQTETGATRTTQTGPDGNYILPGLAVGPYRLQVGREGFSAYVQSGIVLQVNSNPVINVTLKVGAVSEQVQVTADATMVETRDTSIGQVIDQKRISDLPLNGRQITQLIMLSGAAVDAGTNTSNTNLVTNRNQPSAVAISVAGGLGSYTNYLLDGGTHNDPLTNVSLPMPFPDVMQEFKVETNALPARYGVHPGAAVNAVTKSGNNDLHGSLFEFFRNGALNARNFFADRQDTLRRNQFGGTIGGPVIKNKLFYFGGYQGTVNRSDPAVSQAFVPSAAMLAGDFTGAASAACNGGRAITLRGGFVNNRISPALFSAPAVKLATEFLPRSTDPCGFVQYGTPVKSTENQVLARGDYQHTARNTIFSRLFLADYQNPSFYDGKNSLTTVTSGLDDRATSIALGDTFVASPNIVNSFRATFARGRVIRQQSEKLFSPRDLGINITEGVPNFTNLAVTNFFVVGMNPSAPFVSNQLQASNDIDMIHGAHQFSFGGMFIYSRLFGNSGLRANGQITFNATNTGHSLGDFLIGRPNTFVQGALQIISGNVPYAGFYAQDNWRVSRRVNVTYGLRWEPYWPQTHNRDQVSHFSLDDYTAGRRSQVFTNAPIGLTFVGDKGFPGRSANNAKLGNLAPRLGIVWDPRGDGRQTIRAAYGILYDQPLMYMTQQFPNNAPWGTVVTLNNPVGGLADPWKGVAGGNPFPVPDPRPANINFPQNGTYINFPLDARLASVQQWNVSFQKQIHSWLATANYIGNKTSHIWSGYESNPATYIPGNCTTGTTTAACSTAGNIVSRRILSRINPTAGSSYGSILELDPGANANYNGLLLSVQRRFGSGLSVLANYTWSHCINEGESTMNLTNQRQTIARRDRGNCPSDRRQIFNLSTLAAGPKFNNRTAQKVFGDFQFSAILGLNTGPYSTVTTGATDSLAGTATDRPNLVGDPTIQSPSFSRWYNTAAFAGAGTGQFGNVGRGTMQAPGIINVTLGLSRKVKLTERVFTEIRAEAFNAINHANAGNLSTAMNSPRYGTVTSAQDPRIIQIGLKVGF